MNIILFDDPLIREQLLPLTYTRPVGDLRIGIHTIAGKWAARADAQISFHTPAYLRNKFPANITRDNIWVNGAVCPDDAFAKRVKGLAMGEGLQKNSRLLAVRTHEDEVPEVIPGTVHEYAEALHIIDHPWKIFVYNGEELRRDFAQITRGRKSAAILDKATIVYHAEAVFLEEGVTIKAGILNAEAGPIYLGKNTQVQEGAIIRGPFALGENSIINMGGKMRGDTTIGPGCKVGGEISNTIIYGQSNKAHDGFLGNSVIGEWCNLGADTNISNMKNNYKSVRMWSHSRKDFIDTGLTFCGMIMGDHSKSGINTMFNTGTMVGVSANVIGGGYPSAFVPSFSWGTQLTYQLASAIETAGRAMARRSVQITHSDKQILEHVFDQTRSQRSWEKEKP